LAEKPVHYELNDKTAVIRLDDGKANGISPAVIDSLHAMLDQAAQEATAVLILGREGRFSGGFDLGVMRSGPENVRSLVKAGAELFLRIFEYPLPVVIACTGHAVAAGAIALLAADARIGARGDFKIGLTEVAIGMRLPIFAFEFARQRLSKRHFVRATTQAELYTPEQAVDAGFLDRVADPQGLFDAALGEAKRLGELPQPAFRDTKASVNEAAIRTMRETLAADMEKLTGGPST
jgi:enoyl-CoA hydratase